MSIYRCILLFLFAGEALAAGDGFMIGGGVESDGENGLSAAVIGGVGITEKTWLSAGLARSSVELSSGRDLDTVYADLELDHHFDPVGVRASVAYWGDSDVLESNDWRASVYYRNDSFSVAGEYEYRDFDFIIPSTDFTTSRQLEFDADGFGASLRFEIGENVSLRLRGMSYDYSVPFRPIENVDAANLFSVSRLSLINTLVDYRANVTLGIDQGLKRWELDVASWEEIISGSRTDSVTLRFLAPMTDNTDIEFGLGYDDSELYGDVTFFSVYVYLFGPD